MLILREAEWTSLPRTYSDRSFTFPYFYLLILAYLSISNFRREHHFHNYLNRNLVSRSHKGAQSIHYNDRLPEFISEGKTSSKELDKSVCPQAPISFQLLEDLHKLSSSYSSVSKFPSRTQSDSMSRVSKDSGDKVANQPISLPWSSLSTTSLYLQQFGSLRPHS